MILGPELWCSLRCSYIAFCFPVDTSPPTNNGGDDDVMTTSLDDVPLPPEPLTELSPEEGELPLPPPPPVEDSEPVQIGNPVVRDMPFKSSKDENLKTKQIFEQEKNGR